MAFSRVSVALQNLSALGFHSSVAFGSCFCIVCLFVEYTIVISRRMNPVGIYSAMPEAKTLPLYLCIVTGVKNPKWVNHWVSHRRKNVTKPEGRSEEITKSAKG